MAGINISREGITISVSDNVGINEVDVQKVRETLKINGAMC